MRSLRWSLVVLVLLLGAGPASAGTPAADLAADPVPDPAPTWTLPPAGATWDYQIGGARDVPAGAAVVVRDRAEDPAGDYAICYVNAFQTQPDEARAWGRASRRGLVLRDADGRRVADSAWGEWLLDTRTAGKRERLAAIVGRWLDGCADAGYDAAELDNLDSWTRSHHLLTRRDNVVYARLLTAAAHAAGLAVAQKNAVELAPQGPGIGFDLAIAEECGRWHECLPYADAYADRAYLVEYAATPWRAACRAVGDRVGVILRDRMVTPKGPWRSC